jgi:RNA polymerase sigma-70 factor (subfamily 1)
MSSPTSTFGLLERLRAGDKESFTELFTKYRPRLAVLIHYKLSPETRGRVEVDDILQEVFFAASQDIGNFTYRSPGSFMSWLARIADHVIIDAARSMGRQKRHAAEMLRFRSASNPGGPEPVDSHTPSRIFAEQEGLQRLLDKLDALPPDYRDAILMAKVESLSPAEMAERLGKSREAVAVLLHRAIQRLRQLEDVKEPR